MGLCASVTVIQNGRLLLRHAGRNSAVDKAWRHGGEDFVQRTVKIAKALGTDLPRFGAAELRRRYPQFIVPDDAAGYLDPTAGFVRPERCIAAQLKAAQAQGASLHFDEAVHSVAEDGGGVLIVTGADRYCARHVILTAGAWLPGLAGLPFERRLRVLPQAQFWFTAADPELWAEERCPVFMWFHGDQAADFFYGFPLGLWTFNFLEGFSFIANSDSRAEKMGGQPWTGCC
jgi:sarcosine oxidase